jgi:hypothetical protein
MSTQISVTPDELIFQRLLEHQDEQLAAMVKNQALQERLRGEITTSLDQIEHPVIHEIAETVFSEIVRVFGRLTLIENNLHKLDTLLENLSLLDVLQFEIHNFVDYLENEAMRSDAVNGKLHDVLDGICYGISHDLKRIFERDLTGSIREQSTPIVYGKILHAHGLLTNCFQQSVITLMQVFNPSLDPLQVFDDFEERVRQSLTLCNDLSSLMRVARQAEAENTPDALRLVVQDTLKFRDGSMHYLMYRDWRGYEKLALSLIASIEANHDSRDLLHQFSCYLEVLYGHVKMRAVLRDMFPSSDEGVED